jgi:hypothetical protein
LPPIRKSRTDPLHITATPEDADRWATRRTVGIATECRLTRARAEREIHDATRREPVAQFTFGAYVPVAGARRLRADIGVAYSCLMPTKSDPGELGDVEPLADSTASQARRVVAAYANDADECRVFLSMLGIGPAKHDT